jgi:hypothetical protein
MDYILSSDPVSMLDVLVVFLLRLSTPPMSLEEVYNDSAVRYTAN